MEFASLGLNEVMTKRANESSPSDYIRLTSSTVSWLFEWSRTNFGGRALSDIFFARTIPLLDSIIQTNDGKFRVVVFHDYADIVSKSDDIEPVGLIIPEYYNTDLRFMYLFGVKRGDNGLLTGIVGSLNKYERAKREFNGSTQQDHTRDAMQIKSMLATWYAIQIAMLHPQMKCVFDNPQRAAADGIKNNTIAQRKRRTKYIKIHFITDDQIKATMQSRTIERKCLAWYVIGHWREYRSGKKVFVQPYWKGALREMRRNANKDDRERIIAKPMQ